MPLPLEKSDQLHAIAIKLVITQDGRLPKNLNRAAHAQVLTWISAADAELGNFVHNAQDSPISVSDLVGNRKSTRVKAGDEFMLRVGILQGNLLMPLLKGLEQNEVQPVVFADCAFSISGIYAMPGSHPWVGSSQYSLLSKTPGQHEDIVLDFLSPTSFKQEQNIQPFLLPHSVFGSLLKRWNTFAPEPLTLPRVEWKGLVAAHDTKSKAIQMKGGAQIGSIGWVRYKFPDVEQARMASILAHFAFFSGVGRKTAQGMGQTRLRRKPDKPHLVRR